MKRIKLHSKQWDCLCQSNKYGLSAYVGGIRSGKTITGSHFALVMISERPNELGGIFSNTHKQLHKATLKEFKGVLSEYGLHEDEHYVVNKNPSKIFGYRSKFTDHDNVWSFQNGAQIFTFSLEMQVRGVEFGWCWGDEVQDATVDSLNIVLGRMSGSDKPRTLYTLTPPKSNPDIDDMIYGERAIPVTFGTTYDNSRNLPEGYIRQLEERYDKYTFAREVMCQRVILDGLNWMYAFDTARHMSNDAVYIPDEIVYVSLDFNVSPFCATLWHKGVISGQKWMMCFDEIKLTPEETKGQTYIKAMAQAIRLRTPQTDKRRYMITGDASGRNENILGRVGMNVFTELLNEFGVHQSQLVVSNRNMTHQDSRILCNSIFANYPILMINPKCRDTKRDLEFVKANPDGSIKKDSRANVLQQADFFDTVRYMFHNFEREFVRR